MYLRNLFLHCFLSCSLYFLGMTGQIVLVLVFIPFYKVGNSKNSAVFKTEKVEFIKNYFYLHIIFKFPIYEVKFKEMRIVIYVHIFSSWV